MTAVVDNGTIGIIGIITPGDGGFDHRRAIGPGSWDGNGNFLATDISSEDAETQALAQSLWTPAVIAAFKLASPYEAPQPPSAFDQWVSTLKADSSRAAFINAAKNATPAQVRNYINNQVTDLASAKSFLATLTLFVLTHFQD
jgi:hypothetical protein